MTPSRTRPRPRPASATIVPDSPVRVQDDPMGASYDDSSRSGSAFFGTSHHDLQIHGTATETSAGCFSCHLPGTKASVLGESVADRKAGGHPNTSCASSATPSPSPQKQSTARTAANSSRQKSDLRLCQSSSADHGDSGTFSDRYGCDSSSAPTCISGEHSRRRICGNRIVPSTSSSLKPADELELLLLPASENPPTASVATTSICCLTRDSVASSR